MKTTYSEKLKDPRWQKMRLEIMGRDNFMCQHCGDKSSMLSVHHSYYVKGRNVWDYPKWSLVTLCGDCHGYSHDPEYYGGSQQYSWERSMELISTGESDAGLWPDDFSIMATEIYRLATKIGQKRAFAEITRLIIKEGLR